MKDNNNDDETINDNKRIPMDNIRITTNVACRCGNVYQYRGWTGDKKKCPECGREQ